MKVLIDNLDWMAINIVLASISVIFGWLSYVFKKKSLKAFFLIIWLIFLPNSIYIITDLIHIPRELAKIHYYPEKLLLILEFAFLEFSGFLTFFLSLYFFEKILKKMKSESITKNHELIIVAINFIVGFAIVLGRIQRTNSWEIFTNTERFIKDTVNLLSSFEQVLLALIFGAFSNFVYFLLKDRFTAFVSKLDL